ncbi:hypothetical protein C9374_008606 [Naegleria lovaniensis]|uniref:NAD-dependent epimerase/dehydratase domain-containing protein n=1 Tax=Naegleria lovaniensis TaxID=51637 RepID=A0AA88KKM9_NAELO|nr:uncharacterized protein C9374_008606 [Naegleria lovaniensis]KAG2377984.1 hypothetical protein C9374_008606 [Naegleria lovaniensis]
MTAISGVIVTGSTGFIGKHLIHFLLEKNYVVIATNRNNQPSILLDRSEENQKLVHHFGCKMDQPETLHDLFETHRHDSQAIVHLAAIMDFHPLNSYSLKNGKKIMDRMRYVNIEGSKQLFKEFLESPEKKVFIYASSQAAMGPSEGSTPMDEDSPCHPVFEYGKSKLEAEKALQDMLREYQKNPIHGVKHLYILRFTGVTGSGDRYAAFEMIQASSFGINSLAYPGNCDKGLISFVHIDDVCKAIQLCFEYSERNYQDTFSEIFIIGPRESSTVKHILDVCCMNTGWPTPLFSIPLPVFRFMVGLMSPLINWVRWMFFGIQRASFMFASDTIDCMEQNNAYSSQKAISKLRYNPLTCEEAFIKSIKEHIQTNAIPNHQTVRKIRMSLLFGSIVTVSFCIVGLLYIKK